MAGFAAKLPLNRKYGFCVASGWFLLFRGRGEWPLPIFPSGGSVATAAADPKELSGRLQCAPCKGGAYPVGERPTRRNAPAGSTRSNCGGNEMVEAFG